MPATTEYAPLTFLPQSDASIPSVTSPSWNLTRAIHMLRLTIADASLRAREEAHRRPHDGNERWHALGRAQGYQKAAAALRNWTHPAERVGVLAALERLATHGHARATQAVTATTVDFYDAYSWTLDWVLAQVRELCLMHD